jgi:DNA-binding GntR family transcriptional regulator
MPKRMPKEAPSLVDRIVQDIQNGAFQPGAWIKQIDLQARYGVKRLDVRRALDQLALMRVTQHVPNRGHHVYVIDPVQLHSIRELRVLLETGAAAWLTPHITDACIRSIRALAQTFLDVSQCGTVLDMYLANKAFHEGMYALCPNKALVTTIREMRSRMPSSMSMQSGAQGRVARSAREHFDIVAAMEARDLTTLQRLIALHIRQDAFLD